MGVQEHSEPQATLQIAEQRDP